MKQALGSCWKIKHYHATHIKQFRRQTAGAVPKQISDGT